MTIPSINTIKEQCEHYREKFNKLTSVYVCDNPELEGYIEDIENDITTYSNIVKNENNIIDKLSKILNNDIERFYNSKLRDRRQMMVGQLNYIGNKLKKYEDRVIDFIFDEYDEKKNNIIEE